MESGVKDVVDFNQLVRIFVDTDVDTHFIVSVARNSTVAELRELVKVTHRHCYPDSGDVDIGKLAVPGGEYGYHLADFLRIGQVYNTHEGKVFAEVENLNSGSSSGQGIFRQPTLSFKTSLTPKKIPLLAPQPFENGAVRISTNSSGLVPLSDPRVSVGEPGALLAVDLRKELKVPKLQKEEELAGDAVCFLDSQEPLDRLPSRAGGFAAGPFEGALTEKDEKLAESPTPAACDEGAEFSGAHLATKLVHVNSEMCPTDFHMKLDKVGPGTSLASDMKGVSKKRFASESNERPSKTRRLIESAPSGNTSNAPVEDRGFEIGNGAIVGLKDERMKFQGIHNVGKDVNELSAASLSQKLCASDLKADALSPSGSTRRKKKGSLKFDLSISEKRSVKKVKGVKLGLDDKEVTFDDQKDFSATPNLNSLVTTTASIISGTDGKKNKERLDVVDPVNGAGAEVRDINGLEVGKEEKSETLPEESGLPLAQGKKKKKKKLEQLMEVIELGNGLRVEDSGLNGIEVGREEKSDALSEGCAVPLDLDIKDRKKKREQKREQKQKQKQKQKSSVVEVSGINGLEVGREDITDALPEGPGVPDLGKKKKKKTREQKLEREEGTDLGSGSEVVGIDGLKVCREEKPDTLPEGSGVPLELGQKKKKKKKREPNQDSKPLQERKQKEKLRKDDTTLEVCASLNPEQKEPDRGCQQENGQYKTADVIRAVEGPGDDLGATPLSPKHSQHVNSDEQDIVNDVTDVKRKKRVKKKGSPADEDVAHDASSQMGHEDLERPSVLGVPKNGTPRREAQVSKEASGEGMIQTGPMAMGLSNIDDKVLSPKVDLFGNTNDIGTSTSYQAGIEALAERQVAEVNSVESQGTPNLSKQFSGTGAGRGAPSETRSSECSGDVMKRKGTGTRDAKTVDSQCQSSQSTENAKQQSEGINLGSEVSAFWLHRSRAGRAASNSDADSQQIISKHIDKLEVAKSGQVAHPKSSSGDSSSDSDPRHADEVEVRSLENLNKIGDLILDAPPISPSHKSVKGPEKHIDISAKMTEDGEANIKNDSVDFFSQDQSFQVAPAQVLKALSGSTTEDSDDESDTSPVEGTDDAKKQKADHADVAFKDGKSEESSGESGDSPISGLRDSLPLTTRTPTPTGNFPGMRSSGGSQVFKRRASGVAAEIEIKFAQFIESQGGLDEIMGISLSQRKRSIPIESQAKSSAPGTGSPATPAGSQLDLALNTQDSARNGSMTAQGSVVGLERYQAIDIAQASQTSAVKFSTPQFKVPKPVPVGVQGAFRSASITVQPPGQVVSKSSAPKDLRLKRKEPVKQNDNSPLPTLENSKWTFLDGLNAVERSLKSAGNSSLLASPGIPTGTLLEDLNGAERRETSAGKRKKLDGKDQGSQFMVVNNTDHISEDEREEKKLGSQDEPKGSCGVGLHSKSIEIRSDADDIAFSDERDDDARLVSPKNTGKKRKEREVKREIVETGVIVAPEVVGTPEMSGLNSSGKKKKGKKIGIGEKENKKKKFLAEELDGKELNILPENSVERSARETEELYFKLEKANRDLWLQQEASSLRKEEEKTEDRDSSAAEVNDNEVAESEDVAQSRLEGEKTEVGNTSNNKVKGVSGVLVHGGDGDDTHLSPNLCAGTSEGSDREDSAFQSQDENIETLDHQDKYQSKPIDVFDYVSGDELPTKVLSTSAKRNEKTKAERMEELSGRAVQRVLEDEMLHVVDIPGKKSRKDAKPKKWTLKIRDFSPGALTTSPHGGTIPYRGIDATKTIGDGEGSAQVKRGGKTILGGSTPKEKKEKAFKPSKGSNEVAICPVGCGKIYTGKTSAWYSHKRICTGAPPG